MGKYRGYLNSSVYPQADAKGVITTTASPQTFTMIDPTRQVAFGITNIQIDADASNDVKIQFNGDASFEYISAGNSFCIEDLDITAITCTSPVGTKFKFRALAEKVFDNTDRAK